MIYKNFQDMKLSALGMGAMRLPVINGEDSRIDEKAAAEMVAYAMEHGINYYDTAWGYHEGNSETVMGRILDQYPAVPIILQLNSRDMISPIWIKWKKFLKN